MDAVQSGRVSASGWIRWLPGIATLRSYEARWLPHDIAAGLVLTTALAPVGIAYAVASGLPGVYRPLRDHRAPAGLRALRPGQILVLGPNSALAAVILGVTAPLATGDVESRRRACRNDRPSSPARFASLPASRVWGL